MRLIALIAGIWLLAAAEMQLQANQHEEQPADISETDPQAAAAREAELVANPRQLTFEGRRAGEGYFGRDGQQLVFQSERDPANPFFQIYLMDLTTGDLEQISPGIGKTTCGWIHPTGNRVLFASTHEDPQAVEKQRNELAFRNSGQERRYSWDYDEHFEIYDYDRNSGEYRNLTNTPGYDAEGSWSPDGRLIAFTSNRKAYQQALTEEEKKNFAIDPAYLNDIYLMDADGGNVRQLTSVPGYDGGPFFSPDGQRICWRRFSPNGVLAEVWTMNIDGSDQRQLTRLGSMSWAPFYHPSGDYLIFTTNRHGFANFELYLIDVEGKSSPVRVTYKPGFDGLPAFTPDGTQLAWTTNRGGKRQSQIYLADWNHQAALERLGIDSPQLANEQPVDTSAAARTAREAQQQTATGFAAGDIIRHVAYLCREELAGRLTGTRGEQLATAYVAAYLDSLGLEPAGDDGSWYQSFEFTSGVALGSTNLLRAGDREFTIDEDWRPLSFSGTGEFASAPVVFAGYGMQAPAGDGQAEYDSYAHLDVEDKWVLAFRYMPADIPPERRQHLLRAEQIRFKATVARERGARGLILVTGPKAITRSRLIPLRLDGILAGGSLPVISISDEVAEAWLGPEPGQLEKLQSQLDSGAPSMGFEIEGLEVSAQIDIQRVKGTGRNVVARMSVSDHPTEQVIVVGAHIDHLGRGASSSSLARDEEADQIHFGADDNASGVAGMLEIAEYLAGLRRDGNLQARRDILFAAWSGEELGLVGSDHFVDTYPAEQDSLYPAVAAYLNMDMIGRLDQRLILQGIGSSSVWRGEIERRNAPIGLAITLHEDSYLPTDASSFYSAGVPVLSAFTGSHSEYHTPRDTPDTLNYGGAARIARLMGLVARSLARGDAPPDYQEQAAPEQPIRGGLRVYLGTIPDYGEEVSGVLLSGASKNGPADKAGVKGGDVITELAGRKIENIYDYTHAIGLLKVGQPAKLVVQREGKSLELTIVPGSRD